MNTNPLIRLLVLTVTVVPLLLLATSAMAHVEEGSDIPEMATGPSDQVLVHRAHEATRQWWEPAHSAIPAPQPGCPGYVATERDDEGNPSRIEPVFEYCATDRITMYEHRQKPATEASVEDPDATEEDNCVVSYAAYCVEQLAPTDTMRRGTGYSLYGVLYHRGEPVPGKTFYLQRKVLGTQSAFMPFRSQTTQRIGEIGSVTLADLARSKVSYRWAVANDDGQVIHTTVPAVTKVVPTITRATVNRVSVKRKQLFTATARSNVPLWGVVKLQYKHGDRWIQISRVNMAGERYLKIDGRINRTSGKFPTRMVVTGMSVSGRPWYDGVYVNLPTMKVNSSWMVVR